MRAPMRRWPRFQRIAVPAGSLKNQVIAFSVDSSRTLQPSVFAESSAPEASRRVNPKARRVT